jgi:hypothetical protein
VSLGGLVSLLVLTREKSKGEYISARVESTKLTKPSTPTAGML